MQQNWSVDHWAEADGGNAYTSEVARISATRKNLNFCLQFSVSNKSNYDNAADSLKLRVDFSYNSSIAVLKASQ